MRIGACPATGRVGGRVTGLRRERCTARFPARHGASGSRSWCTPARHRGRPSGGVPLALAHRHHSLGVLRWSEAVLTVLTGAGIEGERRVVALRGLLSHVIGSIQLEHLGTLPGPGTTAITELPPAEFPHLTETARDARNVDADQEFLGGLALLLDGLGAQGG
ncbi:TetR/AcrR family transcriptional regulator C-terminal domain-containing protein [Streptomyces sp. INA 01156]